MQPAKTKDDRPEDAQTADAQAGGGAAIRPAAREAPVPPRPVAVRAVPTPPGPAAGSDPAPDPAAGPRLGPAAHPAGASGAAAPAGPVAVPAGDPAAPGPAPAAPPTGPKPGSPPQTPPPQDPDAPQEQMRPPVGKARRRRRHVLIALSLVICVLLPSIGTAIYLWGVADDQYASKVGFSVRREEANSAIDLLGGLTKLSGSSSSDTDILYKFLQSQKLVAEIDEMLDLREIWSRPEFDPVFAVDPDASIEDLVDYWKRMVRISYGSGDGLIEVEVRAFRPEDATLIATTLFDKSSDMINQLSAIAREDAIRYAREELDVGIERLKQARETLTRFRNENQMVNPEMDLQSQAGLLSKLQSQQAETIIEIDLLRDTTRANDPRLEQAHRRLEVIEARIAAERRKLGFEGQAGQDGKAFSELIGDYERLVVDREFAEKAYVSALASYDSSLADAKRKSRYLAAYMSPTEAQTAVYPSRMTLHLVITLFLFLVWAIAVMVYYSIKDRR